MKKFLILLLAGTTLSLSAQKKKSTTETKKDKLLKSSTYSALKFRSVGPALTSGRIADLKVNPQNTSQWYIAAASGGVWKTDNAGTTFRPVFDSQGSYSIGCITLAPSNPHIVWVGTGENNNQRSVGYGDGIYKSEDGGKTWKHKGLKESEHIGMITVDPNDPNRVYVAAYGPLWSSGGDRGIYKSTDGGETWEQKLFISEHTGCNEVHIDPRYPNVLYATAHQRRRREWTYISGGPESAIYKSTDYGETWNKLSTGLPKGDVGRIGLAVSPVNPDYIFAIIEATDKEKGVYRSTDRGASWEKRSGYSSSGNYYVEIYADPVDIDRVYSMDTWAHVSNDGGKTFKWLGEKHKHVDNHALHVDPRDTRHLIMGCDGGLYESWDAAKTWDFKSNLPVTQFYRVTVDNATPFYNIYGGTQDNYTLGGPSRTTSANGITNADWFVTVGGDGFKTVVDPKDPNIVYSQWQYGGLVRHDRKSGEIVDIKPQEKEGEAAYRYNWDAPIVMSNFSNTRLYFAAQKVFRSDDRGNSWTVISDDLSRGIDRNRLPVMGRVWSMDAVAKNKSTSIYGNITALSESPKNEKLLYAGTDDGLIHVTEDGGQTWRKVSSFPGVPSITLNGITVGPLVHNIITSQHDENIAYAVFNNHRSGDFKPYILVTKDKGKSWQNITGDLPEKGAAYTIAEDHVNPDLLFVGTEYGVHFTLNAGKSWTALKGGLPTVCIREIAIQKRENDLVLGTFGRGFYVLDDYSPLQGIKKEDLEKQAHIFPVKDGLVFIPSHPIGHKGKGFQGESYFQTDNPPIGATFTYYLKNSYKTIKDKRKENEKELIKNDQPVYYPSLDSIRIEDLEDKPYVLMVIKDQSGNTIRRIKQSASSGMKRVTWDGRHDVTTSPVNFYVPNPDNPYASAEEGPLAIPGQYTAELVLVNNGVLKALTSPVAFNLKRLNNSTLPVNENEIQAFNKDLGDFRRIVLATNRYRGEMENRVKYIRKALLVTPDVDANIVSDFNTIEKKLDELNLAFNGNRSLSKREFETLRGLVGSVENIVWNLWSTSQEPTGTYKEKLKELKSKFTPLYKEVEKTRALLLVLEKRLDEIDAPYTPGRFPDWK